MSKDAFCTNCKTFIEIGDTKHSGHLIDFRVTNTVDQSYNIIKILSRSIVVGKNTSLQISNTQQELCKGKRGMIAMPCLDQPLNDEGYCLGHEEVINLSKNTSTIIKVTDFIGDLKVWCWGCKASVKIYKFEINVFGRHAVFSDCVHARLLFEFVEEAQKLIEKNLLDYWSLDDIDYYGLVHIVIEDDYKHESNLKQKCEKCEKVFGELKPNAPIHHRKAKSWLCSDCNDCKEVIYENKELTNN